MRRSGFTLVPSPRYRCGQSTTVRHDITVDGAGAEVARRGCRSSARGTGAGAARAKGVMHMGADRSSRRQPAPSSATRSTRPARPVRLSGQGSLAVLAECRSRVRLVVVAVTFVVFMVLCTVLAGCGGGRDKSLSIAVPSTPMRGASRLSGTTASQAKTPPVNGSLPVPRKSESFPPGVDPTSLTSVATAYAKAADPWTVTSFAPQAAFWTSKCLVKRGDAARRAWSVVVSIIPGEQEIYARAHLAKPMPSVPETADILYGNGRRGVSIAEVTPSDRFVDVFFIDPRTGTSKTAMLKLSTFSFVGGAWRYDGC
jgi:hypothetical protein